ncbi:hypothetical protein D5S17_14680 [Pseudonocardiaceae bacterium YIM PH 21723]|nr:hypothetical protein D5S17_14680 [Pseudonocardiaceae bacterium YIM PH 21723]
MTQPDLPRFRILGGTQVLNGEEYCPIELSPTPRAMLSVLLLNVGKEVSRSRLAELIWNPDERPRGVNKTLNTHAHRARALLRQIGISTALIGSRTGFRLNVQARDIDFHRSRRLGERAACMAKMTMYLPAVSLYRTALDSWGGVVLPDLDTDPGIQLRRRVDEIQFRMRLGLLSSQIELQQFADVLREVDRLSADRGRDPDLLHLRLRGLHGLGRTDDLRREYLDYAEHYRSASGRAFVGQAARFYDEISSRSAHRVQERITWNRYS